MARKRDRKTGLNERVMVSRGKKTIECKGKLNPMEETGWCHWAMGRTEKKDPVRAGVPGNSETYNGPNKS